MSWSEAFTAIQQGTIDGQENGFSVTNSVKVNEIQQYMTVWNYTYENYLFVANTEIFNNLEPKTQELIRAKAQEACEWGRNLVENDEDNLREKFICPGIDIPTGSLGQGFACAVGMAIALKIDKKSARVFAVLGDGECQEGEIWEAAQTANKYQLDNLIVFVDNNNLQIDGTTDEVMPNLDLGEKFKAFGFEIYHIDGNDMAQIVRTLDTIRMHSHDHKPKCIIGDTTKGKGVSFMENVGSWHGVAPNKEQYEQALKDIEEGF